MTRVTTGARTAFTLSVLSTELEDEREGDQVPEHTWAGRRPHWVQLRPKAKLSPVRTAWQGRQDRGCVGASPEWPV